MKICAYVQGKYNKQTYSNECMDARQFVGLRIVINELEKAGYSVDYAGIATVHEYDIALVSITALSDWYSFIAEKSRWRPSECRVLVGGAGCLNVEPVLQHFYAAMIGRGEDLIVPLVAGIERGDRFEHESIVYSDDFSPDRAYRIKQAERSYPDEIQLHKGAPWQEGSIGCNHRCLFCSYTYSRKQNVEGVFSWDHKGGTINMSERECAPLDYESGEYEVNFNLIRTTAIDGSSERLRFGVGKKIKNDTVKAFVRDCVSSDASPRLVRIFNIVGYPTETKSDYEEIIRVFREADESIEKSQPKKKWLFSLQNNPFIAYPATPLACAPMRFYDFHGGIRKELGLNLEKFRLYEGAHLDLLESWTIEGLPQIALNAIMARGAQEDAENITKIACSSKFWNASKNAKVATLKKYFDIDKIFGAFTPAELPTRWLRAWCPVENAWGKTPLEAGD